MCGRAKHTGMTQDTPGTQPTPETQCPEAEEWEAAGKCRHLVHPLGSTCLVADCRGLWAQAPPCSVRVSSGSKGSAGPYQTAQGMCVCEQHSCCHPAQLQRTLHTFITGPGHHSACKLRRGGSLSPAGPREIPVLITQKHKPPLRCTEI